MRVVGYVDCDRCRCKIHRPNDENVLTLNGLKYDLCPECFNVLCEVIGGEMGL